MRTIFRVKHESQYTMITNTTLQDANLSLAATGLLSYLLSLPDNWEIKVKVVAKAKRTSEYEVRKVIRELIANGYMTTAIVRDVRGFIKQVIYAVIEVKLDKSIQHPLPETSIIANLT